MGASNQPRFFKKVYAYWVRYFRQDRGLSQEQLADHLDCSTRQVQKVENGQAVPSSFFTSKLSAAMKEDMRQRFTQAIAEASARESGVKVIRRSDSIQ